MAAQLLSSLTMRTAFCAAAHREAAAQRTGCVQRAAKFPGHVLLALVTFGVWNVAKTPCAHLVAKATPVDAQLAGSPAAIAQRRHQRARAFLQAMVQPALAKTHASDNVGDEACCASFPKVYLADRTGCALSESLKETCPGSGGSAAKAGANMHAVWDDKSRGFAPCALTPWNLPEQQ